LKYIGKLDTTKIGYFQDLITTEDIIITNERIEHIKKRHPGDYEKYIEYVIDIIRFPNYVLEDKNNKNTIIILKHLVEQNIQIVIKLQIDRKENRSNSIITFWTIRNRNYKSVIKNNKILYKE